MEYKERVKESNKRLMKGKEGMSVSELMKWNAPAPQNRDTWGRWRYDSKRLVLEYYNKDSSMGYEVDLEDCDTASEVLDWIASLNNKSWTTVEDIGNLVLALNDLLYLQSNIVHLQNDERFDVISHLKGKEGKPSNIFREQADIKYK